MTVETVTYISDLDQNNPAGGDSIAEGDDHIRNIKKSLSSTFPNVTGEVTATHDEINDLVANAGSSGLFASATYNGNQIIGNSPGVSSIQWVDQSANGQPNWYFARINFQRSLEPISSGEGSAANGDVNARANVQVTAFSTAVAPTGFVFPIIVDLEPDYVVVAFLQTQVDGSLAPVWNTGFCLAVFEN